MTALDLEETARQQLERHGLPATVAAMTRLGEASIAAAQRAQTLDPRIAHLYATYRGKRVHESRIHPAASGRGRSSALAVHR